MADGTVGVAQATTPDRSIDNEQAVNDAGVTVFRQRVVSPPLRRLLDYAGRTDNQPVYVGTNVQAALVGDATWTVQRLFYDSSNRPIDAQIKQQLTWSGRAGAAWRSAGGD